MPPGTANIKIYKGDDFELTFRIKNKEDGSYVDLTGCTASAQIRTTEDAVTPLVAFTATIPDPLNGEVTLTLTNVQTAALPVNDDPPKWDVQITTGSGIVTTYLKGSVSVIKEVTRA